MLANRVREFTTTTGTGDITLAGALPGHIRFADGFAAGDTVTYVIEEGDNYEIGEGTLLDDATLERTVPKETLVDGVYDKSGPSALPLSGNAKVFCAATAAFLLDPVTSADVVREVTPDAGVTVDGVLLKDGAIEAASAVIHGPATVRDQAGSAQGLTYSHALQHLDSLGALQSSLSSDATRVYLQSWSSKPLVINGFGNAVRIGSNASFAGNIDVSTTAPKLTLHDTNQGSGSSTIIDGENGNLLLNVDTLNTGGNFVTIRKCGVNALTIDGLNNTTLAGSLTARAMGTSSASISLDNQGTLGRRYDIGSSSTGYGNAGAFYVYDVTAGAERLSINTAGDTTFSGDVQTVKTTGNSLLLSETGDVGGFAIARLKTPSYNYEWNVANGDGTVQLYSQTAGKAFLSFGADGGATLAGGLNAGGVVSLASATLPPTLTQGLLGHHAALGLVSI